MKLEDAEKTINQAMRLNVELGTQMLIQIDGMESRMTSNLVGMVTGNYIIINTPNVAGLGSKVTIGSRVVVRYICRGDIYGFESTVLDTTIRPDRLTFLSYPTFVGNYSLRKNQRVKCHILATAEISGKEYEGMITDISRSGCRFSSRVSGEEGEIQIDIGDDIILNFQLPEVHDIHPFNGYIRNLIQDRDRITVGMEFDESMGDILLKVDNYVQRIKEFEDLEQT